MNKIWTRGFMILAATAWLLGPLAGGMDSSRVYAATKPVLQQPVNVNAASADELQAVSGIGPAIAQRIVEYRSQFGPFESVDDLLNVSGIGPAKFAKMKPQITT